MFCATGLKFVILFIGNAIRPPTKPVGQDGVAGSKICPRNTWELSQGLITGIIGPLGFAGSFIINAGPSSLEKSPVRSASVGRVVWPVEPGLLRYCSQEKKKKVLSWPL